ncbi:MAG: lytic transglycosylase domain-containing protein, partial [Actinomycetota bacterium]|nr:lytic transglycosylase domain-containing protein [Actinomycetota bacterium]
VMQVNTVWIGELAQVSRLPPPEVERRLIGDACFNIAAAGFILHRHLLARHGNLMQAIGDYHSMTPALNARYQDDVTEAARRLFARVTPR